MLGLDAGAEGTSGEPKTERREYSGRPLLRNPFKGPFIRNFSNLSFPRPRWQRPTTLFHNAILEASRSLRSPRNLQPQRSRRWTVFFFNFFWLCPFPDRRSKHNTRARVHIRSTRTDGRVPNSRMVSALESFYLPDSRPLRIQTLSAEGVWPASEVDLTAGCDGRRANWPAQTHWARIREWQRHVVPVIPIYEPRFY